MSEELKQIIDQLPNHTLTHTFASSGVQVSLWHDTLWHGTVKNSANGANIISPCSATTFQEIYGEPGKITPGSLGIAIWNPGSQQELLEAAREQRKKC